MNKTLVATLIFLLYSFVSFSQKKELLIPPDMPRSEENNQVYYMEVVNEEDVSKEELYKRAIIWYRNYFKNPGGIVETLDSVNNKIVLKPQFATFREKDKVKVQSAVAKFTLILGFKEGKYRYEVKDMNLKQTSYYPIERLFKQDDPNIEDNYNTLNEAHKYIISMLSDLESGMREPSNKIKKDEW